MTKGLSAERLTEIAGRVAKATPGPWEATTSGDTQWLIGTAAAGPLVANTLHKNDENNAALIANAPADLADLLAEVERLGLIERSVRRLLAMKQESTRPEDQAIYNTLHGLLTKADAVNTARTPEATP